MVTDIFIKYRSPSPSPPPPPIGKSSRHSVVSPPPRSSRRSAERSMSGRSSARTDEADDVSVRYVAKSPTRHRSDKHRHKHKY